MYEKKNDLVYVSETYYNNKIKSTFKKSKAEIKTELSKLKILAKKGNPIDKPVVNLAVANCHRLIDKSYKLINNIPVTAYDTLWSLVRNEIKSLCLAFGVSSAMLVGGTISATKLINDEEKINSELGTPLTRSDTQAMSKELGAKLGENIKKTTKLATSAYSTRNALRAYGDLARGKSVVDAFNTYKQEYSRVIEKFHKKVDWYERMYERNCKHYKK